MKKRLNLLTISRILVGKINVVKHLTGSHGVAKLDALYLQY
jgi:hypothetical protein